MTLPGKNASGDPRSSLPKVAGMLRLPCGELKNALKWSGSFATVTISGACTSKIACGIGEVGDAPKTNQRYLKFPDQPISAS